MCPSAICTCSCGVPRRACRGPSNVCQNRNRRTTVAVRTSTTPVLATSLARKQGQFRPLRATLPRSTMNDLLQLFTSAGRDDLSGFPTCLRASVGSSEATSALSASVTLNALYAGFVQNLLRLCEWTSGFQSQQFQPIQAHRLLSRSDPDAQGRAPQRLRRGN